MNRPEYDLLVIGGGPAGCTLASLVKKYAPGKRVAILDKDAGPRHQIGESLLPGLVPVLKELGVYEKIDKAGFPRKIGANYVWGRDREVWENDFNDVNMTEMLERSGGKIPERIEYAWQVRRSVYDEILIKHAESLGVELIRGTAALTPIEEDGRIAGVRTADRDIRAHLTADCSGYTGFLSKHRKIREYNQSLKNVAVFGYWKGAEWKYKFNGAPDTTKIFICSVEGGWFWYIPISADEISVGLVTTVERLKGEDPRELYFRQLKACKELWPLLTKAEFVKDVEGTGQDLFTRSDWSYLNVAASGPGWLASGDAAVFVDPILSSGVTLAHVGAHRAAYTVLSHWETGDERLWAAYNVFCRESAAQFLALALFWYGNDRAAEKWWGRAKEIQQAWLPVPLGDHQAFITVSAGLTYHYERLFSTEALAEESATVPKDFPFYASVLGADADLERRGAGLSDGHVPKLLHPYKVELSYVPEYGKGRLRPVKRVRFLKHPEDAPLHDAFNPRRPVLRYHLDLLEGVDGRRNVSAILKGLSAPPWWVNGRARQFLRELSVQGVLA